MRIEYVGRVIGSALINAAVTNQPVQQIGVFKVLPVSNPFVNRLTFHYLGSERGNLFLN